MENNDIQKQLIQLVQAAMSGDKQATEQINQIMDAAKKGDKQAIQIAQFIQQIVQKLSKKAKLGAKLDYIKRLKKECPEGEELVYFKRGGTMDCGCQKVKSVKKGKKLIKKKSC